MTEAARNNTAFSKEFESPQTELIFSILTAVFAGVGLLSTFSVLIVSFLSSSICSKFPFVIGLIVVEWLYCVASLLSSIDKLLLLHHGQLGDLIPAKDCMQKVYPMILIFQGIAPITLFCIALNQCFAICVPILYKNYWRQKYAWYINLTLFAAGVCEIARTVASPHQNQQLVRNWCSVIDWNPFKFYLNLFFCVISTVVVIVTIFAFRNRRMVLFPADRVSATMQVHAKQTNVIRWLSMIAFFQVIFLLVPTLIHLLSLTDQSFFVIPVVCQHFFHLCYVLKSFLIALSTLKLKDYRQIFVHVFHG